MKAKRAVRYFVFGLFFTSLLLVSLILYLELSGKLKDRSACIVLPNEGGYVEAWTPYLSQLSRAFDVSDLSIKTYNSETELYELIHKAENLNILLLEIPLSLDFSLQKAIDDNLLMPLFNAQKVLETSPRVVQSVFLDYFHSENDILFTLPFTMNPIVQVYKQNESENEGKNKVLLPLQSNADVEKFVSFSKMLLYPYLNHFQEEDFIAAIPFLLDYLQLDPVSTSYQKNELIQYFFKNKNKTLLLQTSDLDSFTVEQRLSVSISSLGKTICSEFSYIVFPMRTSENTQEKIKNIQEHLLIPEFAFNIANKRSCLPVHLESISKNVFNDFIKKQVRQADTAMIPALEKEYKPEAITRIINTYLTRTK